MTEDVAGKGLTRRNFLKGVGVVAASAVLSGCLPQDETLVKEVGAVVKATADKRYADKEKRGDEIANREAKLKAEAVEKAKKQTEVVSKTLGITKEQRLEMEKRRADLGMALKGEFDRLGENPQILEWVDFVNSDNPLRGKIAAPRKDNRGSYLRGLPLSTRGETIIKPLTIITAEKRNNQDTFARPVERIQFSISLVLPSGFKQVWCAVETKDLPYSKIEIPNNAKTLSVGDKKYVFFCQTDNNSTYFDLI